MIRKRHTLQKSVHFSGVGLHTGQSTTMTMLPAEAQYGIRFRRVDIGDEAIIAADVSFVDSTTRSTNLKRKDIEVRTVEHILAALHALSIDDVLIEIDGPEVPILDGSAKPFIDQLESVGIKELAGESDYLDIKEPFYFEHESSGAEYFVYPDDSFKVTVLIDYQAKQIAKQHASINHISEFKDQIAHSRTFALASELEELMKLNLIKGGNLSNALIFADVNINQEQWLKMAHNWGIKDISVNQQGLINNNRLVAENEPARHKLLDLVGDLTLVTRPIKGKIIAFKPGHTANVAFANELKKKLLQQKKLRGKPVYDPNKEPIYDIEAIKKMLPHRYPFLLVDKIIELSEKHVVGIKNVTGNESFFQGHFPGNPVFPGVLQMEALAQTGGILAMNNIENPSEWDTYFLKMDQVKFKHKVVPGDTLIMKMELLGPIRRGLVNMQATAYVGDKIVSEGDLLAQLVKKN